MKMITSAQCRAARGLLNWTQAELALRSNTHIQTISNFEKETKIPSRKTLEQILKAIESAGIECLEAGGVCPRQERILTLKGREGFWKFYDDVYETTKKYGGDIFIHNVDEDLYIDWLGEKRWTHKERMHKLKNFRQKIIIKQGDTNFAANYTTTEYRWAPKGEFSTTSFYLYGPKLAIVVFKKGDVSVYIIDQPEISQSYKNIFVSAWDRCQIPQQ